MTTKDALLLLNKLNSTFCENQYTFCVSYELSDDGNIKDRKKKHSLSNQGLSNRVIFLASYFHLQLVLPL